MLGHVDLNSSVAVNSQLVVLYLEVRLGTIVRNVDGNGLCAWLVGCATWIADSDGCGTIANGCDLAVLIDSSDGRCTGGVGHGVGACDAYLCSCSLLNGNLLIGVQCEVGWVTVV